MVLNFADLEINFQWKWLFRPRQRDGMSVDDYYAQFYNWKDEMISLSFPAKEEDYIEGFIENLEWDIRWRSSKYESSRSGLTIAFYNAKFEESMMKLKASHTPVVENQVAEPDPIVFEEINSCSHSDLVSETTDKQPNEVMVINEIFDSVEMLGFDDTMGNDSSNEVPVLEDNMVSESGLQVLSIYCAHMASKWNNTLELRPRQTKDMSVEVYYDLFYNWKMKLDEVDYIGREESYIDDFIFGLELKLGMRVYGYKLKPQTLYGAFRRAELEETMMKNGADKVIEEMPQQNSSDIQGAEIVSDEYSNVVLDPSLVSEFKIKASLLEKDNKSIQLFLQKPVGYKEGNVVDGGVVLSLDLQASLGPIGDLTMNGTDNGSAKAWVEESTLAIKFVFGKYVIKDVVSGLMLGEMAVFDPGGDRIYATSSSARIVPPLCDKAHGTCVSKEGVVLGEIFMKVDAFKVMDEMPKSNSTGKIFNDGIKYGKHTENEAATQSHCEVKNAQNEGNHSHNAERVERNKEEKPKVMEIIPLVSAKVNRYHTLYGPFAFLYVQHDQKSCLTEFELHLAKICSHTGISQADECYKDDIIFLFDPGGRACSLRIWSLKGFFILYYGKLVDDNSSRIFQINDVTSMVEFDIWELGRSLLVIIEYEIDEVVECSVKMNGCYCLWAHLSGILRWISPSSFYVVPAILAIVVWNPGQYVNSFYINEDNDVLKGNGIEIQLVWALKQDDEKLTKASAHYYTHTGILDCFLVDCKILSLLITSSESQIKSLYNLMELLVRSVGYDSIDPNVVKQGKKVNDLGRLDAGLGDTHSSSLVECSKDSVTEITPLYFDEAWLVKIGNY